MQESRLFRILYELLANGKTTAPALARKLEVSVRTIYRDIDALSACGVPIYTIPGISGGIALLDGYTIPKALLSDEERAQILAALQGIDTTTAQENDTLLTKLTAIFQTANSNWIEVDFSDWVRQGRPTQETFQTIKEAIFAQRVVTFHYYGNSGEESKRQVLPLRLVFKSKDWYLYGFCRLREAYRYFKLTRIQSLRILAEHFDPCNLPPEPPRTSPLAQKQLITVTLKFDKMLAFRVYDEFSDPIHTDADGNLILTTMLPDSETLFAYLLSFSDGVEILAPADLRARFYEKLEKIRKKYES